MKIISCNHRGFTLIEIITSIVIISIISVIAGMGLYQIARGYVFFRNNSDTAQQAQIAMTRLKKETGNIKSVTTGTATSTSITFTRSSDMTQHTISWVGGNSPLLIDSYTLIGPVTLFNLYYYDSYSSKSSYSSKTSMIEIHLQLKGAENTTLDFVDRVNLYLETGG